MTELVGELAVRAHMTVLMVTHDAEDARRIAGRVVLVENGRIVHSGAVEEVLDRIRSR
jgi:ABC-type thiamine transport system ATPase subunit